VSSNQLHGKKFEDFIKACGLFPGASDSSRSINAGFDIEAKFDRRKGLPTSIKTSGSDVIALSDARRFFSVDEDFRMIIGRYEQAEDRKIFNQVHEIIVTRQVSAMLKGAVTVEMVNAMHEGLALAKFPRGAHGAAREWVQSRKAELACMKSKVILNPKVDSKTQRRLQCSVNLVYPREAAEQYGEYVLHEKAIGDFVLPIIQNSAPRRFRRR
jgi:hypothetical protein